MEASYLIANFHTLCRFCLQKTTLAVSVFGSVPDSDTNVSIASKISECFEVQMDPSDGLPAKMCYKCLFKLDKCSKFRIQCIQSESKLREITRSTELDTSNSSELSSNYNYKNTQETVKPKAEEFIVEDSVVMVVDPSMDYDSSEESEPAADKEPADRDNTPENEPVAENFLKNVFLCQYCDQAFVSDDKRREHEKACHDPNMPFKCFECSLIFAERAQNIQHLKQVHGNDKPYVCRECDKCFGRRSDLKKHSIVHIIRVVKRELGIKLSPDKVKCEGCIYGKSQRKPFGTRERTSTCKNTNPPMSRIAEQGLEGVRSKRDQVLASDEEQICREDRCAIEDDDDDFFEAQEELEVIEPIVTPQSSYNLRNRSTINGILERFRMNDCNPVTTPIERTSEAGKVHHSNEGGSEAKAYSPERWTGTPFTLAPMRESVKVGVEHRCKKFAYSCQPDKMYF